MNIKLELTNKLKEEQLSYLSRADLENFIRINQQTSIKKLSDLIGSTIQDFQLKFVELGKCKINFNKHMRQSFERYHLVFTFFSNFHFQITTSSEIQRSAHLFDTESDKNQSKLYQGIMLFMNEFNSMSTQFSDLKQRIKAEILDEIMVSRIKPYENNIKIFNKQLEKCQNKYKTKIALLKNKLLIIQGFSGQSWTKMQDKPVFQQFIDAFSLLQAVTTQFSGYLEQFLHIRREIMTLDHQRLLLIREAISKFDAILSDFFGTENIVHLK